MNPANNISPELQKKLKDCKSREEMEKLLAEHGLSMEEDILNIVGGGTGPLDETGPLGTGPLGTGPLGTGPLGTGPLGTGPLSTGPLGTGPLGTGPLGTGPLGTGPLGTGPLGTGPLKDK